MTDSNFTHDNFEEKENSPMKIFLKNGLLLGATMSVIYLIVYLIKPELNFGWLFSISLSILPPIFFIRKAILEQRQEYEGSITFGEAMTAGFPTFIIGSLIFTLVTVSIFTIDSSYKDLGNKIALDMQKEAMEKTFEIAAKFNANIPEEEKQKAFTDLENNPQDVASISLNFLGFLTSLIFPGAIISLISAAILKRT